MLRFSILLACVLTASAAGAAPNIRINEIMYHPMHPGGPEDVLQEWIELHNAGSTNVSLSGWRFSRGVNFTFGDVTIPAGEHVVVTADPGTFLSMHDAEGPVVGPWSGKLSNGGEAIELEDATGQTIDRVVYADQGDWAQRKRGISDLGFRGWDWYAEHDGLGKSLELRTHLLPNEEGQAWASSVSVNGSPGGGNSTFAFNIAPMLLDVRHFPVVPTSADPVTITVRVVDELASGLTVELKHRVDANPAPGFTTLPMLDDGLSGDGAAGDGVYGAILGALPSGTVVEFYVFAEDAAGNPRTWPGPALRADDQTPGPAAQSANALYQVDDSSQNAYSGGQPIYKMIMTEIERAEMQSIPSVARDSNARMNMTFISLDGAGTELLYQASVRNRGHGSRGASPPNYHLDFPSDRGWKGVEGLNLNTRQVHMQHLGAVVAQKAGAAGANTRAVQVRVNGQNRASSGSPMFGAYAANEVLDGDWAENHFPLDSAGNIYRAIHDLFPGNFNYRGENPASYQNTYFKASNEGEDDWSDLVAMLRVMGDGNVTPFTEEDVRAVIHVEQWMAHLAVMNILNNNESGLNTGNNDDYFMYAGADGRFRLLYWDLDEINITSGLPDNLTIFLSGTSQYGDSRGPSYQAFGRFLHHPDFEPIYYRLVQRLIDTTFSAVEFGALVDQTLGGYVPAGTLTSIKDDMGRRRAAIQAELNGNVTPANDPPVATLAGVPRARTPLNGATITVGGENVTHYISSLNGGPYSAESDIITPIVLSGLANGSTNVVTVVGRNGAGVWQPFTNATVSRAWVVDTSTPAVRINEVLARNDSVLDHSGTFPDAIELYNEGGTPVDLSGMRLSDSASNPDKYTFPDGTSLAGNDYLVVYANNSDGSLGIHLGFSLVQQGDDLHLFEPVATGGELIDSVVFGAQLADLSIGRLGSGGEWVLTTPTFGTANQAQPLGDPAGLKINEWLASGQTPIAEDFLELYNPSGSPVALGGLYLSDEPIGYPAQHRIPDLNFIAAGGFASFVADGTEGAEGRVRFRLSADQGNIGLFSLTHGPIDCVFYGPQQTDVSSGRCPDGAVTVTPLSLSTPGAPNVCPVVGVPPELVTLVGGSHVWRYEQPGTDLGTSWRDPGYNDSGWPQGPGILALENCGCLPDLIRTTLNAPTVQRPTFYFRTTFEAPVGGNISSYLIEHAIDDGAVIYLNGVELLRYNMGPGTISYLTEASGFVGNADQYSAPFTIPANMVQPGVNTLAVEVHNHPNNYSDVVMGLKVSGVIVTNTPSGAGIVINEVLANNATLKEADGSTPDWVEFYNPSAGAVDLAGMSVTDDLGDLRRWTFGPGSLISGFGFLSIRFEAGAPVSADNTGFGLSAAGDSLYLVDAVENGGGILDAISFGLQAADFSIGRQFDGEALWGLSQPTIGGPGLPVSTGNAALVKVNEWMADPASGDDWFEIYNPSPQPVDVSRFYLTDDLNDRTKTQLPPLSFIGTQTNAWQRFEADNNAAAGADHTGFRLSAGGETIGISTPAGVLLDGIAFGQQLPGVSEGRLPDGSGPVVAFETTASPAARNYLPLTAVVISEVLSHSDLPLEDAIELQNVSPGPVDVSGWWLSDDEDIPEKYSIPPGTILPPGGFTVLYENAFNDSDVGPIPFGLSSAGGDQVYLSEVAGSVLTGKRVGVRFGPAENAVAFGRFQTSEEAHFVAMAANTFGNDAGATVEQFRMGTGLSNSYAKVGPVIISEIMYHPPDLGTNDNTRDEFVELRNITGSPVALYDPAFPTNGWQLRKGIDFDFASGTIIPAGGHLVVVSFDPVLDPAERAAFEAVYGTGLTLAGPYLGRLSNSGETIELKKPDRPETGEGPDFGLVPYIEVEKVAYSGTNAWPATPDGGGHSLQRLSDFLYANDPVNWTAGVPGPGPGGGPADSDSDGMPDDWETLHGLNPNDPGDASLDGDDDGVSNLDEYRSGTDPTDRDSYLKVEAIAVNGGIRSISFLAVAGKTYSVIYLDAFPGAPWRRLMDVPAQVAPGLVTVSDNAPGAQRYYRLVTPAQ